MLRIPYTGRIVQTFVDLCAELALLEALPDMPALVDRLFPAGQNATRAIREACMAVLGADLEIERSDFVTEVVMRVTVPEIPTNVEYVRIMSLHKSKGLSAPVTIICGCIEGLLPRRPDPDLTPHEQAEFMEEQRRLFYVGITRVKADPGHGKPGTLILTYAQEMPFADAMQAGIQPARQAYDAALLLASRFIREMAPATPAPQAG